MPHHRLQTDTRGITMDAVNQHPARWNANHRTLLLLLLLLPMLWKKFPHCRYTPKWSARRGGHFEPNMLGSGSPPPPHPPPPANPQTPPPPSWQWQEGGSRCLACCHAPPCVWRSFSCGAKKLPTQRPTLFWSVGFPLAFARTSVWGGAYISRPLSTTWVFVPPLSCPSPPLPPPAHTALVCAVVSLGLSRSWCCIPLLMSPVQRWCWNAGKVLQSSKWRSRRSASTSWRLHAPRHALRSRGLHLGVRAVHWDELLLMHGIPLPSTVVPQPRLCFVFPSPAWAWPVPRSIGQTGLWSTCSATSRPQNHRTPGAYPSVLGGLVVAVPSWRWVSDRPCPCALWPSVSPHFHRRSWTRRTATDTYKCTIQMPAGTFALKTRGVAWELLHRSARGSPRRNPPLLVGPRGACPLVQAFCMGGPPACPLPHCSSLAARCRGAHCAVACLVRMHHHVVRPDVKVMLPALHNCRTRSVDARRCVPVVQCWSDMWVAVTLWVSEGSRPATILTGGRERRERRAREVGTVRRKEWTTGQWGREWTQQLRDLEMMEGRAETAPGVLSQSTVCEEGRGRRGTEASVPISPESGHSMPRAVPCTTERSGLPSHGLLKSPPECTMANAAAWGTAGGTGLQAGDGVLSTAETFEAKATNRSPSHRASTTTKCVRPGVAERLCVACRRMSV